MPDHNTSTSATNGWCCSKHGDVTAVPHSQLRELLLLWSSQGLEEAQQQALAAELGADSEAHVALGELVMYFLG